MDHEFNLTYNFTNTNSKLQKERHQLVKGLMEDALKDLDPELRKKFIPEGGLCGIAMCQISLLML